MFKGDSEWDMCCLNNVKDDDQTSIYYDEHWTHFKAESTERSLRLRLLQSLHQSVFNTWEGCVRSARMATTIGERWEIDIKMWELGGRRVVAYLGSHKGEAGGGGKLSHPLVVLVIM